MLSVMALTFTAAALFSLCEGFSPVVRTLTINKTRSHLNAKANPLSSSLLLLLLLPPPEASEPGKDLPCKRGGSEEYPGRRRRFVSSFFLSAMVVGPNLLRDPESAVAEEIEAPKPPPGKRKIIRLSSGLQFSDARVGSGSPVDPSGDENSKANSSAVVLMHLRAFKRDGSILLDTYSEGRPLLFRAGSIPAEELYYLNEGSALQKGRIPLGVQDAILAPGAASWEGGYGRADPMRTGGLRMVVVPPELAYGTKGVSRYEAFKLGLNAPVARYEVLRYEIELFRCNDESFELPGGGNYDAEEGGSAGTTSARVCCPEELYPCPTNNTPQQ